MEKTSKTILFFGTEDFSLTSLEALVEADFKIGAVITKSDTRRGRGGKQTPPKVKSFALEHNIPVLQPETTDELEKFIQSFSEPAGVLVSYGRIIPQSTIDLFTPGIINVHPSLLPKYRGPTPIESAIINGDNETGVSIMQLDKRMDAGPVYAQKVYPLQGNETKPQLYDTLATMGAELLINTLPSILSGDLQPVPQDENDASYCPWLTKENTLIDPTAKTAQEIERQIRAHLTFPKTRLPFYDDNRIIVKAKVSNTPSQKAIECKDKTWLSVEELIAPSGKTIDTASFLRGLHTK